MNDFGIVHLKDEKFDSIPTREMQLLIKIAPKRISYAIVNEKDNSLVVLYDSPIKTSVENSLNELFRNNDDFRSGFAAVKVSVHTSNFTLLPAEYFTMENIQQYEKLISAGGKTKTFISPMHSNSIKCVMALNIQTTAPIISAFSDLQLFSQIEPFVEAGLKIRDTNPHKLLLQFSDDCFEASLISEEKLILYNLYSIKNAEDFNYYLLLIMEQLAIDAKNTSVILAGNIESDQENYKRISKYFGDVRFADSSEIISFSGVFNKTSKHQHLSLLGLILCE